MSIFRLLKYSTTFALIWILAFCGAEGVFRLLGDTPSADLDGLYMQFGDAYKQRPSVDTGAQWSTGYFSVHTDELGLRCDGARQMKTSPGDHVDVLFMGDSQGFGNGVNFEDTIPGTVASLARAQNYVVRNACVSGHHPPNQLALAQWLRDDEKLRVSTYVYLFTPVAIASCNSPVAARVGDDGQLYGETVDSMVQSRRWVKTHSVAYSRIRDAVRSEGIGVQPDEETPFVFRLYSSNPPEPLNGNKCGEFLQRFKQFAALDGATVQAVYVPLTLETNFDTIRQGAERHGLAVDSETPFRILSEAAKQANIPVHDLRPVLQSMYLKGQPLSLLPDFHYTGAVSKASGENIWQRIYSSIQR